MSLALASGPASAQSPCRGADDIPTAGTLRAARAATLCLLNQQRAQHGLRPLRANRRLRISATRHSKDMVARHYFDHVSQDGSTFDQRIRRSGYIPRRGGWQIGENIAWGAGELASPSHTVEAWMGSPGHRRNILTRGFRDIGIGIAPGAPEDLPSDIAGATYTTDFGSRH
ncbi:hypothetical protein DSM104329_04044 [Capillimicrobium parvum]|uniref:SCP domain-containing protein n=2 Tax=Capillimicrobium parvum TaxID=2884022 RepID=A0A9E6Y068_9ACTN|nr:hypothetical protein DSM104329_04044 [Capillimicrobium parvum]